MHETAKLYEVRRNRNDFKNYLRGKGIDIGCGSDCLKVDEGEVRPWDIDDGDAQLLAGVPDGEFDFVYSSHCLEHVRNVPETLTNWARVLKPGGFLYVVVPDYILYEKMTWPSRFNEDHKQSFSILVPRRVVARDNHFLISEDLTPILNQLGMDVVRCTYEDYGFNYNAGIFDQTKLESTVAQICVVAKKR
jgi:SAM-dependent methyltransferase